jgi:glucose-1-phosphate cytidylyltransferase
MKVVILAGGHGTRLAEFTKKIPKPMVKIKKIPIIEHIIKHYAKFGFKDFYIAAGYKKNIIRNYFKKKKIKLNIEVIDTGQKSMTGGRIKKLKKIIGNNKFLLTYGDGLSNVNLNKLIKFHNRSKNIVTLTAVRPPARFGGLKLKGKKVKYFKEKSSLDEGWINGGFFVMEPKILNFIKNSKTVLEREPLEKLCKNNKLGAFRHTGSWQCMDTIRDKDKLENMLKKKLFN